MRFRKMAIGLAALSWTGVAQAAPSFGVVSANTKVRPQDSPSLLDTARLTAARNEFEAFQVVVRAEGGPAQGVSVRLSKPLKGPAAIPDKNVALYRVGYYQAANPSNTEGAAGPWPDPLIPDIDTYVGEKRNAFPFDIAEGETGAVWVDVLVPQDAPPGDYTGELEVSASGTVLGVVPIELRVGNFALPSTSSLASAFGMGWADPCLAHTGQVSCTTSWDEDKGNQLRAVYLRSALEHRITISDTDYQPPLGPSAAHYEKYVLPYLNGTGTSRLPGARITAVAIDGGDDDLADWVAYAKSKGFFDRLFYYPVDEPSNATAWNQLIASAKAAHDADPDTRVIITSSIQDATANGATDQVDIFVPVINFMDDKPGGDHAGNQRSSYASWQSARPNRTVWAYQSCMSHGCGQCGTTTDEPYFTGWPQYVIDSTAVQNRCFSWLAFNYDLTGELYFNMTYQLTTAWDSDGQCAFGGSGDGTLLYPGKPDVIGGTQDIPIESIRMKLIREGREDYEYLRLAASSDEAATRALATALFPHPYECAQPAAKLEQTRAELFARLDEPVAAAGGSGGSADAGVGGSSGSAGNATAGSGGNLPDAGASAVIADEAEDDGGGCGCRTRSTGADVAGGLSLLGVALTMLRRRRCGKVVRKLPSIE